MVLTRPVAVSIAREQNISVVTGTQIFNDLSLNVRTNSATKIACGFSDKIEQAKFCNSIGITNKPQIQQLDSELRPGRALASSHKHSHPFLIDVPFPNLEQQISDKVILKRLLHMSESIYHENDVERVKLDLRSDLGISPENVICLPYLRNKATGSTANAGTKRSTIEKSNYYKEALKLIKYIINNEKQFLFYLEILKGVGVTSGSMKVKLKETAVKMGWVKEHRIQISRNQQVILELLNPAYEICKTAKPIFRSKGAFPHQFVTKRVSESLMQNGYKVKVEFFLSNNKAVDIVAEKENQLMFIEIACSKIESEQNILDDLSTPLHPSVLYICCKNARLRNAQNKLLKSSAKLKQFHSKIRVCLAGELLELH